ncbi:hypothetical protein G6T08_005064, partial [Salmonella enterica]|nr:hypothetical protein [Salmonella enterica]
MNHIYRVIWNASTACWQAVPENSRCHTKTKSKCVSKTASTTRYIRMMCLATLIGFLTSVGSPVAWAGEPPATIEPSSPPPKPSSTSRPDETVTNPITGLETTVTKILVDPPGTETAGKTAFVQTADGYTFLVKTAGEKFYNNDSPPVAFTIESFSGADAVVTSKDAKGSAKFTVSQKTTTFDKNFNSTGSEGELKPPENVTGPDGVKQVNYGRNGNNGRAGALFVPPSSGGNGQTGQLNRQTLSSNINATSGIGWEIGSVGGTGGKGGDAWLSFWDARDGGNGGAGGEVNATQTESSIIKSQSGKIKSQGGKEQELPGYGIFAYSRSGQAGKGGTGYAATGGGGGGHSSDGGEVYVSQHGTISTRGENAHGIYALSVSNNGGNGGNQWGLVGSAGNGGYGGNGGKVNVNTSTGGAILTQNDYSDGILAQSVGGTGGSAGSSGDLLVSLIGSPDNGGNGNEVTVSNDGFIQTMGTASRGIMAQSIGGGGGTGGTAGGLIALALGGVGNNGGSGDKVSVTNGISGVINTTGDLADGIMAQSLGGSGGKGANAYGLVSIGGSGTKGGDGKDVTVENYGLIHTKGHGARGIVAQSIGGGGGDGGASGGMVAVGGNGKGGGSGATVNVTNKGVITTEGADSMG